MSHYASLDLNIHKIIRRVSPILIYIDIFLKIIVKRVVCKTKNSNMSYCLYLFIIVGRWKIIVIKDFLVSRKVIFFLMTNGMASMTDIIQLSGL